MNISAVQSTSAHTRPPRPLGFWLLTWMLSGSVLSGPAFALLAAGWLPGMDAQHPLAHSMAWVGRFAVLGGAIPAAALVYGLLRERPWTQPGLMAYVIVGVVTWPLVMTRLLAVDVPLTSLVGSAAAVALFWWYLYRKPGVVAYYASLPRDR